MKLKATINNFALYPDPKYGAALVTYPDAGKEYELIIVGFKDSIDKLVLKQTYKMQIKIESKYWPQQNKYSTSAFLLSARKEKKFNPNAGYDRKGLDVALWKNTDK